MGETLISLIPFVGTNLSAAVSGIIKFVSEIK